MISKTDIILEAIRTEGHLSFDYVSTSRKITLHRVVHPIELAFTDKHGAKMWAYDLQKDNLLKQFDIEGIQDPIIIKKGGE